jgi:hypothetical protein
MLQGITYGQQYDEWAFFNHSGDGTYHISDHVVQFDGPTKTIWILNGIDEVLVKEHLYSDWKEWIATYDMTKYLQAFETEGGRPISATERLGDTYLLINDWVIRQKDSSTPVNILGNLYGYDLAGDPQDPYGTDPDGGRSINSTVSNIVNTVVIETAAPPSLTDEQSWILRLAYEEAKRARQMQTNNVTITTTGTGVNKVDMITVFDDNGTDELYRIRVDGEDCDNRTLITPIPKPICPLDDLPDECTP